MKQLGAGSLVVLALVAASAPSFAQERVFELRISHSVATSHPLQKAFEDWGNSVERNSGGTIKFKIYPAQQLGTAAEHYNLVRDNKTDVAYVNPGLQAARFPVIEAANLPLLISDAKGGTAAIDEWYRNHTAAEMKDVRLCLAFVHDPGTFHAASKKIVLPADLRGMKVWTVHPTMMRLVAQLGGTLEQTSADAVTSTWGALLQSGLERFTRYHLDAPLYTTGLVVAFNKKTYQDMAPAQRRVIDAHCNTEWALKFATPWADNERSALPKLKAMSGHEIYGLSSQQRAEWRKAAEPLIRAWSADAQKAAGRSDSLLEDFQNVLKKYGAAY